MVGELRGVALIPEQDIASVDGRWISTSAEPWLRFARSDAFPRGAAVELRYRISIFDDPVRPILRFSTERGPVDHLLPGPVAGLGIWIGRAPVDTLHASLSPTSRTGRFDFRVDSLHRVSSARLYSRALSQAPAHAFGASVSGLIGVRHAHERNMTRGVGFTPTERYAAWKRVRHRPLELEGIDTPRADWTMSPRVRLRIETRGFSAAAIAATAGSLVAQWFKHWRCRFVIDDDAKAAAEVKQWRVRDPRFVTSDRKEGSADYPAFLMALEAGDVLAPEAFACLIEHAARHARHRYVYADEEFVGPQGGLEPLFKPGWSPSLQAARPYVGRMVAYLARDKKEARFFARAASVAPPIDADPAEVGRMRRVLMRAARPYAATSEPTGPALHATSRTSRVAIVIPSRNRLPLLKACLDSIESETVGRNYEVIVVDNGSDQPAVLRYYEELAVSQRRVKIIYAPGPFNFAHLCNTGARVSTAPVLLFLNNDTEVRTPDWLDRLGALAMEPTIGAVGAKLLFPSGKIQHIHLTLGLMGRADHIDQLADPEPPGWLGRNITRHECSAVAAACLAVSRDKFDAVGGFDTEFQIELNDVDFCLRLAARGWRCVTAPDVVLLHREAASRGGLASLRLPGHQRERTLFLSRWSDRVRDDPYFHPGWSLNRLKPALS